MDFSRASGAGQEVRTASLLMWRSSVGGENLGKQQQSMCCLISTERGFLTTAGADSRRNTYMSQWRVYGASKTGAINPRKLPDWLRGRESWSDFMSAGRGKREVWEEEEEEEQWEGI